ncbi:unnamed protein product [Notodromas monacha]|uniref:Saccharopine dehydrogenase NADP binding domain-containing protein n=1 Tax=Notodromas monacha TaxID=399045 RepID=A0A7R9G9Z1_9CRUS|nr:unnamed protein product [Notodromas monacha]CAG0914768.1 unnamed protein product [Notodromas monacha]
MRPYDLVVFGASGFTGHYVVREILKMKKQANYSALKWAVAGRNGSKIKETLASVSVSTGEDLSKVPILIADVKDASSLEKMAEKAEVVVNVVGPNYVSHCSFQYRFFGEPVVKACVEKGASHVDISGEAQYLERMQLEYHKKALDKQVYVVGACGFDSIPVEMGIIHLRDNFGGDLNAVEQYMRFFPGPKGYVVNSGTWKSAVYEFATVQEINKIRRKLFPTRLPPSSHKLKIRPVLHKDPLKGKWSIPFPGPDRTVVMRSQRFFYENSDNKPVQMGSYLSFASLLNSVSVMLFGAVFAALAKIPFARDFLANNPKLITFGAFSDEGPSKSQIEGCRFSEILIGTGWDEKLPRNVSHQQEPNTTKILEVAGPDPGYVGTSICLVQSALTILKEKNKLPSQGGVYPPGAAFAKTSIIQNLQKNGVTFTFL